MPAPSYTQQAFVTTYYAFAWEDGSHQSGAVNTILDYQNYQNIISHTTPGWRSKPKRARSLDVENYQKIWSRFRDPLQVVTVSGQNVTVGHPDFGKQFLLIYGETYFDGRTWLFDPGWRKEDVQSVAVNDLLTKINVVKSQTLVSAAEFHKTASLVASSATKIAEALKALRQLNLAGMAKAIGLTVTTKQVVHYDKRRREVHRAMFDHYGDYAKQTGSSTYLPSERTMARYGSKPELQKFMQDTWLEYRYGWRPLLADIYDQAQALAQQTTERQNVVRQCKGRGHAIDKYESSFIDPLNPIWTYRYKREEERWCEYGVFYRVDEGVLNALNTFGILNPLSVAWELVPFSFIADWFIPVGNALSNLTATIGLEFVTGYRTDRVSRNRIGSFTGRGSDAILILGGRSLDAQGELKGTQDDYQYDRTRLIEFPSAQLPRFTNPLATNNYLARAGDSIALLSSLFLTGNSGRSTLRT